MKRRIIAYILVIIGVVLIASGAPYVLRWVTSGWGTQRYMFAPEKEIAMIAAGSGILAAGLLSRK